MINNAEAKQNLGENMEKRLDNYCKSEKYFTATLLSYLFINDEFKGLKKFLGFLNEISCYPIYFSNETRPMDIKKILLTSEIHFVTEMNVERDLIANNFSINPKAFSRKKKNKLYQMLLLLSKILY